MKGWSANHPFTVSTLVVTVYLKASYYLCVHTVVPTLAHL